MFQRPVAPRARVVLSALLLLSIVASLATSNVIPTQTASAAFPGSNGRIAFTSERDDNLDIYTMDPDGENVTRLTFDSEWDMEPDWSPDGQRIAFTSTRSNPDESFSADIFVMDADGSNQTRLTASPAFEHRPSWSPDGNRIAYNRQVSGGWYRVFVMDADGGNQTQITSGAASPGSNDNSPAWSPDGSKIAFANGDIYTVSPNGSNLVNLTNGAVSSTATPAWSPDGSKLVFRAAGNQQIFVMDADGSDITQLTDGTRINSDPEWSPDGAHIVFSRLFADSWEIVAMDPDGGNLTQLTSNDALDVDPSWQPLPGCALLLVPGIAGTYAVDPSDDLIWLVNRGAHPDQMVVDPLGRVYHDLISTLENVGYEQGNDLFVVTYDWRLPPAPFDGAIDGVVSGLSGESITDGLFEHSVDYFGHFLKQAVEAREQDDPGARLECVDVIAHSTGGLVTRSYIQSTAYRDSFTSANGERDLPRVNELIMLGVPNRGASKAWNPLHDNWGIDDTYRVVLSKIILRAWEKVVSWNVHINGPDGAITRASIDDGAGNPDPMRFIQQYVPTIGALLATYDFLDTGSGFEDVNSDPQWRNSLLLDLNDGFDLQPTADPSPFADHSTPTVIYGTDQPTATGVIQRLGPDGGEDAILPFTDFAARDAGSGETWYQDIQPPVSGDGTVPIDSAAGQFFGDDRVTLIPLSSATTTGKTDHTGLVANPDVQATMLSILGRPFAPADIATGSSPDIWAALSVIVDPVEGYVQDGLGRRLGYTSASGALTEIPGSAWFGTTDGFGIVTEPLVLPLTLHLVGIGEPYFVHVIFEHDGSTGGITADGFLGEGETLILPVELAQEPPPEGTHFQACLFAGSLSQVSAIGTSTATTVSCGRGTAIVLLAGEDLLACLFAGSLSQVGTSEPRCSRGEIVVFASGAGYHGCVYAGSLSQVGTSMPASCGRGARVSLSGPVAR